MDEIERRLSRAVCQFWNARRQQSKRQGVATGRRDTGARTAVTGGKHLDGFVTLCRDLLIEAGVSSESVFIGRRTELPGYFRPEKRWDLIVIAERQLLAAIEFKSQVGSFGNNFNNRTEEALGNATDLWTAYREGGFAPSPRPWIGFLLLLEECERSTSPVATKASHFPIFPDFVDASYARRYELMMTRLIRERLYYGACLLLSDSNGGAKGRSKSPSLELSFSRFASTFVTYVAGMAKAVAST